MRRVWTQDAGLPAPLTNRPVFDLHGRHLGTPDLIDPSAGVLGEYDGGVHLLPERRRRDLATEEAYRASGLEVVRMVSGDEGPFRHRLLRAYAQARRRPLADRAFTLELPHWWVPTFTVAQRRALTAAQRRTWLRRGAA